jgi:thiol-disulfide isomerase/thioredoxin
MYEMYGIPAMSRSKTIVVAVIAALLALAAGLFTGLQRSEERVSEPAAAAGAATVLPAAVMTQFFATRLNDDSGRLQPIEQWRGKILVVNFWATWCQPCREEMPSFSRLQTKYADRSVQFIGIALDSASRVAAFRASLPISYPLLIAENEGSALTQQMGNSRLALPYTLVIEKNGGVRLTRLGRLAEADLDAMLQTMTAH